MSLIHLMSKPSRLYTYHCTCAVFIHRLHSIKLHSDSWILRVIKSSDELSHAKVYCSHCMCEGVQNGYTGRGRGSFSYVIMTRSWSKIKVQFFTTVQTGVNRPSQQISQLLLPVLPMLKPFLMPYLSGCIIYLLCSQSVIRSWCKE